MKYDVLLVSIGDTVTVNGLTVKDELDILSVSNLGHHTWFDKMNRLAFNKIEKPCLFSNYEDFIEKATVEDRDSIIMGILNATYKDEMQVSISCDKCNEKELYKLSLHDSCIINLFEKPEGIRFPTEIRRLITIENPPCEVIIRVPSLKNFYDILRYSDFTFKKENDKLAFSAFAMPVWLFLEEVKIFRENSEPIEIKSKKIIDMVSFIESLPVVVYKYLVNYFNKEVYPDKTGIKISFEYVCSSCGQKSSKEYLPSDLFFLQMQS